MVEDFKYVKISDAYSEFCFEGEISKAQLAQLQQELKLYIDKELDSVIIFKSRQEKWLDKEFWGRKDDATSFIL